MAINDLSDRPWLLLPGTLCTGAVFDPLMAALGVDAAQRQHVELDKPSVDDYRAIFENLPKDCIVCGFSLGAIVAAHAAPHSDVGLLILFALNPFADDPSRAADRQALVRDVTEQGGGAALAARKPVFYGATPAATQATVFGMADRTAHLIAPQTQLALTRPSTWPALAKAQMPVLALTGTQDHICPPAHGQAAADAAPRGQYRGLDGLGHFALLENAPACAAAITEMMKPRDDEL